MLVYSTGNFSNINKTKESLNSGGQQFHQYLQNEQPPLKTKKGPWHILLDIQVLDYGQAQKYGGVKLVNGILTLPSCYMDLQQQYRYKQTTTTKTAQIHFLCGTTEINYSQTKPKMHYFCIMSINITMFMISCPWIPGEKINQRFTCEMC